MVRLFEFKTASVWSALSLCVLGLAGCSSSGSNLGSNISLGYSGNDVAQVRQEVSSGLPWAKNASATGAKSASKSEKKTTAVARLNNKKIRSPKQVASKAPQLDIQEARDLINSYRQARGLRPLIVDSQLSRAAENHSRDLARRDEISHYGSDGSTPWMRVERSGFKPKVAAENVGTGQDNLKEVLKSWRTSKSHNENLLLSDATHMGMALVHKPGSKNKTFWTLVVGAN